MRLLLIVIGMLGCALGHSKSCMLINNGNIPVPATISYPDHSIVLCYINPGERVVADTHCYYDFRFIEIYKQDGNCGCVLRESLDFADDTSLFKFSYPENLFPFTKDSSNYFHPSTTTSGAWGGILLWMERESDRADTFNIPRLTKLAYYGDTTAMVTLLLQDYGDSHVAGQYNFNRWKLLNCWSDSAFAELLLAQWVNHYVRPSSFFLGMETPFGEEGRAFNNYLANYYPLSYSLKIREYKRPYELTTKEIKRYHKKFRHGSIH